MQTIHYGVDGVNDSDNDNTYQFNPDNDDDDDDDDEVNDSDHDDKDQFKPDFSFPVAPTLVFPPPVQWHLRHDQVHLHLRYVEQISPEHHPLLWKHSLEQKV